MTELTPNTPSLDVIFGTKAGSKVCKSEHADGSAGISPLNPSCPKCGGNKLWRDGNKYTIFEDRIQRWLCKECGHRFLDRADLKRAKQAVETVRTVDTQSLKTQTNIVEASQICVTETKNLAAEQQTTQVPRRNEENRGKIIEHAFWMQKEGYAESTISRRIRLLGTLVNKGANLQDPESIKETIAQQKSWTTKTKQIAVETYDCFLKSQGLTWKKPIYQAVKKLPFIPTEEEINNLIAGCNKKTATFLQLLKETGMRCGEAFMLQWTDFDFENKTVNITPEKGSDPRQLKISMRLIMMLNSLPRNKDKPFACSHRHFARAFRLQRAKIANKLKNDRILKIHFHTLRHWKATMEYAKTKDILHVMKMLGHRNIQNTLLYTQLISFESDEYFSATAKTVQDAQKLVEAGFDYVCEFNEVKIFKKRK
jgi:integrase/transposase-like protein